PPRTPARHLAIARLRVGGRQSDVARELGVSQSVISRLASRHRTTGRVCERPRSGAPRVTDPRLQDVRGTRVSRQTILNRLHRFGLNARRPLQVTPLTPRHHRERLQWAQDHVTWTMQQRSRSCSLMSVGSPCTEMMVVSIAGEGEVQKNDLNVF
uniref:Transposase Tc1-like domain-containing protein n=1 Tax=Periophthalmus magnuspinnatus TaxID=409849 RepID=A0A3B4AQM0_9GOBI